MSCWLITHGPPPSQFQIPMRGNEEELEAQLVAARAGFKSP